jgi:hypothetical protein
MGGVRNFKPGDHVRHKDCVHEEGIVLARSEDPDKKNYYFVVFCKGTQYEAKPWLRYLHSNQLSLIERELHKPKEPPKFKK